MTKTKKQLRAEAVERLRSIPNEYMNATSVVVAIAGEAAYRLGGTRDARDMCIDLLTDDDSTTESLSDGTDSREKLLEDANAVAIDYWDRKRTWGDANDLKRDVTALLDRQAAITAEETRCKWVVATADEIARLRDENMNLARDLGECMADRDRYRALCGQMLDAAHEIRRIADANMPEVAKEVLK